MLVVGIGLVWVGAGAALIAAPAWWTGLMTRVFREPAARFVAGQLMLFLGLLLIVGSASYGASWAWVGVGAIAVLKGLFFLGGPQGLRYRLMEWWERVPAWTQRGAGALLVALAVLWVVDMLRALR